MKNYILCEDVSCRYYARTKKELIDFIKHYYKNPKEFGAIESLKKIDIWSISYDARKIDVDNFFGDVIATEKRTGEDIDYDLYKKYGIADKKEKKDFLYYSI